MHRTYYDKAHNELVSACDKAMDEFDDCIGTIKDDIGVLIEDIRRKDVSDTEEIVDRLTDIFDSIEA